LAPDISKMPVAELQKKIKDLTALGETDAVAKYQAELNKRQGKTELASATSGVTADDWDKAGSKFPKEGLHHAEFFAGEWKTVNQSVDLKFVLDGEDDEDKGKEGNLYPGTSAKSIWRFKEICKALGVEPIFKNGVLNVAAMLPSFAGKSGMVQYVPQKDTRKPEDGGTGGTYTKPITVVAVGTEVEEPPF
jgi:hypothetical protein